MIYSMTGFASESLKLPEGELAWEIRSVNHRYLEAQFKLPEGFRQFEHALREQVAAQIKRGKLDASLKFRPADNSMAALSINAELAAQVINHAEQLAAGMTTASKIDPLDIMRWPGVVEEKRLDIDALSEPAKELLSQSIKALQATRGSEGERIAAMLESRLEKISLLVIDVRSRLPEVMQGIRERVAERARTLETRVDPDRLEQELVLLAQKLDVAEELDRLDAHIEETRAALKTDKPIGRRLDFLMQEFNREANTLASKSGDPATSTIAVDLKVLIEQMREQVQNVE
jgi:uncharacterized protein (TIGR00255 family)